MKNKYFIVYSRVKLTRMYYSKRKKRFVFGIITSDYPYIARYGLFKYVLFKNFFKSFAAYKNIKSDLKKLGMKKDSFLPVIIDGRTNSLMAIGSSNEFPKHYFSETAYLNMEDEKIVTSMWIDVNNFFCLRKLKKILTK